MQTLIPFLRHPFQGKLVILIAIRSEDESNKPEITKIVLELQVE